MPTKNVCQERLVKMVTNKFPLDIKQISKFGAQGKNYKYMNPLKLNDNESLFSCINAKELSQYFACKCKSNLFQNSDHIRKWEAAASKLHY